MDKNQAIVLIQVSCTMFDSITFNQEVSVAKFMSYIYEGRRICCVLHCVFVHSFLPLLEHPGTSVGCQVQLLNHYILWYADLLP